MADSGKTVVAYLGPEASYTHQAALNLFPPTTHILRPYPSISAVFSSLSDHNISLAVVPLENSSNGAVLPTLDLLSAPPTAHTIVTETYIPVHHALLARSVSGSAPPLSHLTTLHSHPQAWGQCRAFLDTNLARTERVDEGSTASAAARVAALPPGSGHACIASPLAGDVYGLTAVQTGIEDRGDNETRFVVLGRAGADVTAGRWKSLLHFRTGDEPGALAGALSVFGRWGLRLSSFYSRPDGGWSYVFFVEFWWDVEEGRGDERAMAAVEELKLHTRDLAVCGTWRSGR